MSVQTFHWLLPNQYLKRLAVASRMQKSRLIRSRFGLRQRLGSEHAMMEHGSEPPPAPWLMRLGD
jgi:hypothetical protein